MSEGTVSFSECLPRPLPFLDLITRCQGGNLSGRNPVICMRFHTQWLLCNCQVAPNVFI